jgi:tetratricopeptide (TPR) repeat protein
MRKKRVVATGKLLILIAVAIFFSEVTISGSPSSQLKEDERITYYYRDPQPNELIPILESVLREKDAISNSKRVRPLVHFFATAMRKNKNKVKDLRTLQQKYSGEARRVIQTLIEEANHYHPADLKSAGDLELLWSEYKATGKREIIERLMKVISETTPSGANHLRDPVKQFLIKMAPHHFEVYEILRKRSESSGIGEIVSIINRFAFDPATNHLSRGLNLYLERKYNEAMGEFNRGLGYFPDYCSIYMNIANIYDDQNNMKEAVRTGKKAVSIEPENTGAIANVGRFYYRLKDYDEAIKWYQKALEYDPKKIDCHYGLGITYASKRDTGKAVIHFKKYLEYAPNGSHVAYVKRYLSSVGQTAEEDQENVAVMLQNKKYDVLEKTLLSHLREKKREKDGVASLSQAYKKLCDVQEPERAYAAKLAQFKAWLSQYSSSHFANACLGIVYISYAWDARGSGYASTITDQGSRLFSDRLSTAKEYLEKAYSLDRSDPIVPANLIYVAMGLGLERKEVERQLQRAILADPTDHEAYFAKLEYVKPKWYGSKEEMFSFAREAVRKAPPNSMIPMVLVAAHWEMYHRLDDNVSYFRNPSVWKEMKEVYQTVSKSFPEAKTTNNWFARTAYLAGDYEVAREELKKIGDDWRRGVWGDKKAFEEVKRELLGR